MLHLLLPGPKVKRMQVLTLAVLLLGPSCEKKSRYADPPPLKAPDFEVFLPHSQRKLSAEIPPHGLAVLFFGYRGCPDICSSALKRIGEAHAALDEDSGNRIRTVFVEVGPTSLAEAGAYARSFDPGIGIAKDPDGRISRPLQVFVQSVENSRPARIEHSGAILLIDHSLTARKRLPHDISAADLMHEIEVILLKEGS